MPSVPTVLCVVGARPNFVKVAPLFHALRDLPGLAPALLHTGQHYDRSLSDVFLEQLALPAPAHHLGVGSGTHAEQTAAVLVGTERVLLAAPPAALVVAGDVNSTLGAGLAAVKLGVPVVHLEAGLRSGDWTMPEEVNRVLVDRLADLLLVHSPDAVANLAREGIAADRVALVGNTMIDSLRRLLPAARATGVVGRLRLAAGGYALVTLHRPSLVDDPPRLSAVLDVLGALARELPVVFPLHPRTRAHLPDAARAVPGLHLLDPLDYLEFVALEESARLVVTDSGGVQEETSALGVPCLTYRTTTERPITIERGTNRLVGVEPAALAAAAREVLAAPPPAPQPIPLWDGSAGVRAAAAVERLVRQRET
jgi:UDP-N-acetylglucosamine 2-epimerase (non-hydrolysing)